MNGESARTPLLSSSKDELDETTNSCCNTYLANGSKIAKTILWMTVWMALGAFTEIVGPVLPELMAQMDSDYEGIIRANAMRGAGLAAGSIAGLWLIDRLFKHLHGLAALIMALYLMIGVASAYVTDITTLFIVYLLQGSLEGWIQTAAVHALLKVWEQRFSASIFALQLAFAIGKAIVPKIVDPFLNGNRSTTHNARDFYFLNRTEIKTVISYPSNFVNGYWVLAAMSSPLVLIFLALYCLESKAKPNIGIESEPVQQPDPKPVTKSIIENFDPKSCSPSKPILGAILVILCMLYYGLSTSVIRAFPKFLFSYARSGPQLSVNNSTWLQSGYFCGMIFGRIIAITVSIYYPSNYIMLVSSVGFLTSAVVLLLFHTNIDVLWAALPTMGFFIGPIIPAAFATLHNYIELTTLAIIIATIGGSIGDITVMYSLSSAYEYGGPYVLWPYMTGLAAGQLLVSSLMLIVAQIHGVRYK